MWWECGGEIVTGGWRECGGGSMMVGVWWWECGSGSVVVGVWRWECSGSTATCHCLPMGPQSRMSVVATSGRCTGSVAVATSNDDAELATAMR